jgi:hypothetical protein
MRCFGCNVFMQRALTLGGGARAVDLLVAVVEASEFERRLDDEQRAPQRGAVGALASLHAAQRLVRITATDADGSRGKRRVRRSLADDDDDAVAAAASAASSVDEVPGSPSVGSPSNSSRRRPSAPVSSSGGGGGETSEPSRRDKSAATDGDAMHKSPARRASTLRPSSSAPSQHDSASRSPALARSSSRSSATGEVSPRAHQRSASTRPGAVDALPNSLPRATSRGSSVGGGGDASPAPTRATPQSPLRLSREGAIEHTGLPPSRSARALSGRRVRGGRVRVVHTHKHRAHVCRTCYHQPTTDRRPIC